MAKEEVVTAGEGNAEFEISPEVIRMATGCFDRADEALRRNNYDFAIVMYLEGLRYSPDDVERGHKPLYEAAVRRKAGTKKQGWSLSKSMSDMKFSLKQMTGKKKDAFVELEKAMTDDPDNYLVLITLAQMSSSLGLKNTPVFFAAQVMETADKAGKMNESIAVQMADIYESRGLFRQSMDCLQTAEYLDKHNLGRYLKRIRDLAARTTIGAGLESAESFKERLKNETEAEKDARQKVRTAEDDLVQEAEALTAQLADKPNDLNLMILIGDTYARAGRDEPAMQYYRKARAASGGGDYRIKVKMDDLRMRQIRHELRVIDDELHKTPDDEEIKKKRAEVVEKRNQFEVQVFTERAEQYPTDMVVRYELGVRQYRIHETGKAIASFQLAKNDPKHKIISLNMLGKCFFNMKLYQESAAQFRAAIQGYELEGDLMWKELRYNLGLVYEAMKKYEEGVNCYSEIVMADYEYRDAATRLKNLRAKMEGGDGQSDAEKLMQDDGGM